MHWGNIGKSRIIFPKNMENVQKAELCQALEMIQLLTNVKYLGIPTYWGRLKSQTLGYILEKKARNEAIFEIKDPDPRAVVYKTNRSCTVIHVESESSLDQVGNATDDDNSAWIPPDQNKVKFTCDGA
ncbi:unnamed protein product [Ilex paraguariensis]|uniref:Uncharacterized protein n=1 Tax=Ilex paraguariensis TaxID=185542 RepID=A0ABC8UTW6_9AQUA